MYIKLKMICGLGNYLLTFGIILSNGATVVYVYPIFLEYIIEYELKNSFSNIDICRYISFLFLAYEISKYIGNYIWIKISNAIGVQICINISLFLLTIMNCLFSYTCGIYSAIIVRAMTGLVNNLSGLSKQYIFEIFKVQDHNNVTKLSSIMINFSTVIGFLIGGLLHTEFKSVDFGGFTLGLNKFLPASVLIGFINLITLLGNILKSNMSLEIEKRVSRVQDNMEIQIEHGSVNKKVEEDKFTVKSNDSKNPSLVLYDKDCLSRKESSKNLEEVLEKDDNNQDYSSRSKKSYDSNSKDRSYYTNRVKIDYFKTEVLETNFDKSNDENENKDLKPDNLEINKLNSSENITSIYHNNKSFFKISNDLSKKHSNYNLVKMIGNTKKNNEILHFHSKSSINLNKVKKKLENQELNEGDKPDDALKEINDINNHLNNDNKIMIEPAKLLSKSSNLFVISLKISFIIVMSHASDAINYNLFYCILFGKKTFGLDYVNISIVYALTHGSYTIITPISTFFLMKYCKNDEKKAHKSLNFLIILTTLINFLTPIFYISGKDLNFGKLMCTCGLFLFRNILSCNCLTCYNFLLNKMNNYKVKSNINDYNMYLTSLIKTICGFLTFLLSFIILEYSLYLSLVFSFISGVLYLTSYFLTNQFKTFITSLNN